MSESHKKYMKRINKLAASEPGGPKRMDGTSAKRNCVIEAQKAAFRRQYEGDPERKR